jgi:serine protease AprX
MKKQLFSLVFLGILLMVLTTTSTLEAQTISSKYMVSFHDKDSTPYVVTNPSAYLSPRAIARRVKFAIPVTTQDLPVYPVYLDSLTARGVKVLGASKWFNAALVEVNDSAIAMDLLTLPFVTAVDLLYYVIGPKKRIGEGSGIKSVDQALPASLQSPVTEGAAGARGVKSGINYGYSFAQANMLGVNYLHQMGFKGDSMIIAVLDAGFSGADVLPVFDSLHLNNRILSTRNFVNPQDPVYGSSTHGMMVLSTMGGNLPGQLVGTAPNASYHLLLSEDVATEFPVEEFYWALAAEYADSAGADMINSSLGYTTFDHPVLNHTYQDMDGKSNLSSRAATIAASRGVLVVASAGNGGGSSWFYISSPGDADSIITAGAVNNSGLYAPFSSTGPSFDQRVKPDVVSVGWDAVIAGFGGGYTTGNGTSFSSPILCGAIACLWQANPRMSNMQIIDAVRRSGHQYSFPDTLLGYGIPNLAVAHLVLGGQEIPSLTDDKTFTVAPNPFNDMVFVTFYAGDTQSVSLELYSMRGRLLHSRTVTKQAGMNVIALTDLDALSSGVYLLKILDGKEVITRKIIRK